MATYVAADGRPFENELQTREAGNPDFAFMSGTGPEHDYYRWRVFATMMKEAAAAGKHRGKKTPEKCRLQKGGKVWHAVGLGDFDDDDKAIDGKVMEPEAVVAPAVYPAETEDDEKYASRGQRTGDALVRDVDAFETMLTKAGDLGRASVRDAMFFAIDKADAARQLVDLMATRFARAGTTKGDRDLALGLLYVVSDVLHNSGAPSRGARLYRTLLRPILPTAFRKLGIATPEEEASSRPSMSSFSRGGSSLMSRSSFSGGGLLTRTSSSLLVSSLSSLAQQQQQQQQPPAVSTTSDQGEAEAWRKKVLAIPNAWLRWSHVFPPTFVCGLELTFLLAKGQDDGDGRALRFAEAYDDNDPEIDALKRDARLAGLDDGQPKPILERRLGLIRLFVRHRTLGLAASPALARAKQEELDRGGADSDDSDAPPEDHRPDNVVSPNNTGSSSNANPHFPEPPPPLPPPAVPAGGGFSGLCAMANDFLDRQQGRQDDDFGLDLDDDDGGSVAPMAPPPVVSSLRRSGLSGLPLAAATTTTSQRDHVRRPGLSTSSGEKRRRADSADDSVESHQSKPSNASSSSSDHRSHQRLRKDSSSL